jgi:iron complex outermembrane receptor protein
MNIDTLELREAEHNSLKSLTGNKSKSRLLSADMVNVLKKSTVKTETLTRNRTTLNGAAMIFAGACLLAPDYSFAEETPGDLAAEVERLKEELGTTKKENEQLKKAVADSNAKAVEAVPASVVTNPGAVAAPAAVSVAEAEKEKGLEAQAPKALGEVVVNSRRKEEKLQDVPLPVSVVGSETTKRDNIVSVSEITQKIPNLLFTASNSRQTSIGLRGLGKNSSDEARDPSVGVQVDNVPIIWPGAAYTNFVDLDHIEFLRGPQGTLQGKNANLGLLNIITKTPTWKPEYSIEGFAGDRNSLQGKASGSGALIDGLLAYRGSFYIDTRDGYVDNLDSLVTVGKLKETNRVGGRLQFLFTPTEKLSARIIMDRASATNTQIVDYNIADPLRFTSGALRASPTKNTYSNSLARFQVNGRPYQPLMGNARQVDFNDIRPSRGDQQGISGEINYDIARHKLTSITAYRYGLFEPHNDGDKSPYDISSVAGGTVQARQWSQELRLTSQEPGFGFIDYQVGALGLKTENKVLSQTYYGADAGKFYATDAQYGRLSQTGIGRQMMQNSLQGLLVSTANTPTVLSLSGFGQADIHITPKATLTLGVRDTWEDRNNSANKYYSAPISTAALATSVTGATAQNITDAQAIRGNGISGGQLGKVYGDVGSQGFTQNSQNWLVNPSYKITKDLMTYFSVAGGQKSGAATYNSSGVSVIVKPEQVLDFELGIKSALFDRKLFVNLNLYDTQVGDYQANLQSLDPAKPGQGVYQSNTGNIKGIEMRGVELETTWNAYKGTNVFLNAAYNNAIYTDFADAPCAAELNQSKPCNYTGKTIPNAPEFTLNFGADYRRPLGYYGLDGVVFVNNSFRSGANMAADLSQYGWQHAYHLTDGGLGVATHNGKYNLTLIARNIFDTRYLTNVGSISSTSAATGVQGEARYFGVNFRTNF